MHSCDQVVTVDDRRPSPPRGTDGWSGRFRSSVDAAAAGSVVAVAPDGERGTSFEAIGHAAVDPPRLGSDAGVPPPEVPVIPSRRNHRWGLGAYLLVEAVFLGASALIGLVMGRPGPSVGALAVALAVPTVLAAGTAVLVTVLRGNGPRIDLGLVWSWRDVRTGLLYGFGGLAVTIPASVLYVVLVGADNATTAVGEVFAGLRAGPVAAIGVLLVVVLLAPLCEEIVYRGLLWGAVERYTARRWVPFGVTTLLFALAHVEFTRTPLLFVVALPIALARLHTGRLVASVVAHQVNNLLPGLVLMLALLGVVPV
jgi:membrane protease YdiL (CAAX protease family)